MTKLKQNRYENPDVGSVEGFRADRQSDLPLTIHLHYRLIANFLTLQQKLYPLEFDLSNRSYIF